MAAEKRRLAHAAGFRRVAEMPLPRQRNDEFELVDHASRPLTHAIGTILALRRAIINLKATM